MQPQQSSVWLVAMSVTLAAALWPASAQAQWRYPGYYAPRDLTAVRFLVTPKEAKVYVDGYYAGIVDDFNGVFQRLNVPAGAHEIVLYLEGYRTVHQKIYLTPDSTYKLHDTMEKNLAGETSEPPPTPPAPPVAGEMPSGPPQGPMPRGPRRGPYPPATYPPQAPYPPQPPPAQSPTPATSEFGTLIVRVQPAGADVMIDGEQWHGPEGDERLVIQLSEGSHHVEISKGGYRRYTGEVQVRRGETVPLNVSLNQGDK